MGALPSSCDPQKTAAGISYTVFYNLYDGLTEVDDQGNLLPKLATAWKQLDAKRLQLTLRQGVK
jgi:peptide/nickel transport system substrate-binding protein